MSAVLRSLPDFAQGANPLHQIVDQRSGGGCVHEARIWPEDAAQGMIFAMGSGKFAHDDIQFHRALVAGQPSARLARMHELLMGEIELCIGQVQSAQLLTSGEVADQHQGILDAITAGDATAAERMARAHITGARDRLLNHLDTTN